MTALLATDQDVIIDIRDIRPVSVWSRLPSLGPVNTAEAVWGLYRKASRRA